MKNHVTALRGLPINTLNKTPVCTIPYEIWKQVQYFVDKVPTECKWYHTVTREVTEGFIEYHFDHLFIPTQDVTAIEAATQADSFVKMWNEMKTMFPDTYKEIAPRMTVWCHSHVKMQPAPSTQDVKNFKGMYQEESSGHEAQPQIMMILNKMDEYRIDVWDSEVGMLFEGVPLVVLEPLEIDYSYIDTAIKEKLTKPKVTHTVGGYSLPHHMRSNTSHGSMTAAGARYYGLTNSEYEIMGVDQKKSVASAKKPTKNTGKTSTTHIVSSMGTPKISALYDRVNSYLSLHNTPKIFNCSPGVVNDYLFDDQCYEGRPGETGPEILVKEGHSFQTWFPSALRSQEQANNAHTRMVDVLIALDEKMSHVGAYMFRLFLNFLRESEALEHFDKELEKNKAWTPVYELLQEGPPDIEEAKKIYKGQDPLHREQETFYIAFVEDVDERLTARLSIKHILWAAVLAAQLETISWKKGFPAGKSPTEYFPKTWNRLIESK